MASSITSNIPNLIMMVRPKHFGFNLQTAASNSFQSNAKVDKVAEKAREEFDNLHELLKAHKIRTKVFEDVDDPLPDAVFPNNWISHIPGKALIVYPMQTPNRRAEVRKDIIDWCRKTLDFKRFIDLSPEAGKEIYLEGTGSVVFNHDNRVAYACVSPRTNLKLLSRLTELLEYYVVSFESLDVQGNQIYHTNVMMSIGHEVILVCLESINDQIEQLMLKESLKKTGKLIIELSYAQIAQFAGNALEVRNEEGEVFYVMSKTAEHALTEKQHQQISRYAQILSVDISTIEQIGGGSVRCMMAGFFV